MTTRCPNFQPQLGSGAPVHTAPEGTIYIDDAAGPPVNMYVFYLGAWHLMS